MPALDADSYAVRDLAVEQTEHLLADDLRDELALRLVGDHVLREQLRTLDGVLRKLAQQVVQTLARARGDGHDRLELVRCGVGRDDVQQLLLLDRVDLVDDEDSGHMMCLDLRDQAFLGRADVRDRLDHQHRRIHLGDRVGHDLAHIVAQLCARLVQTRRVQKDVLRAVFVQKTRDARARGLRLARDDGHLLADELVGERALAHVRAADDRDDRSLGYFHEKYLLKN